MLKAWCTNRCGECLSLSVCHSLSVSPHLSPLPYFFTPEHNSVRSTNRSVYRPVHIRMRASHLEIRKVILQCLSVCLSLSVSPHLSPLPPSEALPSSLLPSHGPSLLPLLTLPFPLSLSLQCVRMCLSLFSLVSVCVCVCVCSCVCVTSMYVFVFCVFLCG